MTEHFEDQFPSWTEIETDEISADPLDDTSKDLKLLPAMQDASKKAANFLNCLGNPHRLQILTLLMDCEKTVSEISTLLKTPQSFTSQHLSRLRRAGLVRANRRGRFVFYTMETCAAEEILQILYKHLCIEGHDVSSCRGHKAKRREEKSKRDHLTRQA